MAGGAGGVAAGDRVIVVGLQRPRLRRLSRSDPRKVSAGTRLNSEQVAATNPAGITGTGQLPVIA